MTPESSPNNPWRESLPPTHRLTYRLLNAFFDFDSLISDWNRLSQEIPDHGLQHFSQNFLNSLYLQVESSGHTDLLNRTQSSLLFVGLNHSAYFEPFIIASQIPRTDISFIGNAAYTHLLGPHMSRYILPVMPVRYATDSPKPLKHHLTNYFDFVKPYYTSQQLTKDQILTLNKEALNQAANLLSQNHAVVIFPNGGNSIHKPWYNGISTIVTQLINQQIDSTLVPFWITGLTKSHALTLILQRNHPHPPSKVYLHIGSPLTITNLIAKLTQPSVSQLQQIILDSNPQLSTLNL